MASEPEYTEEQQETMLLVESIANIMASLPPDEDENQYDANLIDSLARATAHCRKLMLAVGLDPDNTPTGIFL